MAQSEPPQFYTYGQDVGKEVPMTAFRTSADHKDSPELLSDMLAEVLTSFLNNNRGGSLYYGVEVVENAPKGKPCVCPEDSAAEEERKSPPVCGCCHTEPRYEECHTDGTGRVRGISEEEANRDHLQKQLEKAFTYIRPKVSPACCTIFLVPVMNMPSAYTSRYVAVFKLLPPAVPYPPFEHVRRDSAVEEHVKLTRKLSDLVGAISELSNVFSQVYQPRYQAAAIMESMTTSNDPHRRLQSLEQCNRYNRDNKNNM